MQPYREVVITYPAWWKTAYRNGRLVRQWQKERPKAFAPVHSGITGGRGLFAQAALAWLLSEQGYWSTSWYKLALDPAKVRGRDEAGEIAVRQAIVAACIGPDRLAKLRQLLLDRRLTNFKGEPDLFCWRPRTGLWFFAEAKDEHDRLTEQQVRWMSAAKDGLGDGTDLRVYSMVPEGASKAR